MRKISYFIFVTVFFLISVAFAISGIGQTPKDHDGKIILDQHVLTLDCRPGTRGENAPSKSFVVKARVHVKEKTGREEFKYTAEYGKIFEEGGKADWDLTGERAGTYIISVSVLKNGAEVGHYDASLRIEESNCGGSCECPIIEVAASAKTVKNGYTLTFNATVSGGASITYNWIVENGEIVHGQNTDTIKVKATRNHALDAVKVTVGITGLDPGCACQTEASSSAIIIL